MVTYLVVYQQDPKSMYQNLLNFIHMIIIPETNLLLQVIPVTKTGRDVIKPLITIPFINILKQRKKGNNLPKKSPPKEIVVNKRSTINGYLHVSKD